MTKTAHILREAQARLVKHYGLRLNPFDLRYLTGAVRDKRATYVCPNDADSGASVYAIQWGGQWVYLSVTAHGDLVAVLTPAEATALLMGQLTVDPEAETEAETEPTRPPQPDEEDPNRRRSIDHVIQRLRERYNFNANRRHVENLTTLIAEGKGEDLGPSENPRSHIYLVLWRGMAVYAVYDHHRRRIYTVLDPKQAAVSVALMRLTLALAEA